jgi:hypothetical protein
VHYAVMRYQLPIAVDLIEIFYFMSNSTVILYLLLMPVLDVDSEEAKAQDNAHRCRDYYTQRHHNFCANLILSEKNAVILIFCTLCNRVS